MFESTPLPIDYDPLANIAEYAILYNQKHGTNHPQFYQGSYAQVKKIILILNKMFYKKKAL